MATSCARPATERNIIVDQPPFSQVTLPYREGSEAAIVAVVQDFARENGMDFLTGPGHPTLDAGQFNLTVAAPSLNLSAVRLLTTLPNIEVFAISSGTPNDRDAALAAEFVRRLQQVQQSQS